MEPVHDFGKEARENELLQIANRKRRIRKTFTLIPLLLAAILVISFRSDIGKSFTKSAGNDKVKSPGKNSKKEIPEGGEKNSEIKASTNGFTIVKQWTLPKELLEISGLTWVDESRLGCVQDESGTVFIYNMKSSSIERKIPFAGPGDYEGIAVVNKSAWVLRSDGNLFEIVDLESSRPSVKEYDTPLDISFDTEGLCYDKKNNRLLIASKESGSAPSGEKGVYAFDLTTKQMQKTPIFKINISTSSPAATKSKKKTKENNVIMPSGISVHPLTGDIYITEGRKPKLLITDATAKVKQLYELDKNDFNQPEGITFSPGGDLFISNEGSSQPGNIIQLKLNP